VKFEIVRFEKLNEIANLVKDTINNVYPRYYPKGAVEFFAELHFLDKIKENYDKEIIMAALHNDRLIGTGSIHKNEIKRVFIIQEFQSTGFGTSLMDELEKNIFCNYDDIEIDASLPAYKFYSNRGYASMEYIKLETKYNHYLCYHHMQKKKIKYS